MSTQAKSVTRSNMGFGCASVMGKVGRRQALKALHAAHEAGIAHFDVARSYGFGRAEGLLGEFLRGRRDQVSVTSKFGVVPPELSWKTRMLMPVARAVAANIPSVAARLRKRSGEVLSEKFFELNYARACLDKSLRELGTDHLDIYLLHEPPVLTDAQGQELVEFMRGLVRSGKIKHWGIACQAMDDHEWAESLDPDVIQTEGHLLNGRALVANGFAANSRPLLITRPFCGGLSEHVHATVEQHAPGLTQELLSEGHGLADLALAVSLELAGPGGCVIGAMYNHGHIHRNAELALNVSSSPKLQRLAKRYLASLDAA